MENTEENSEMTWKIWKKSKSNSDKIWTIWKKGKLNSEMIWNKENTEENSKKNQGKYRRKIS
jgi:hypothetical protein